MATLPLALINRGEKAKVEEINGGDNFSKKMMEMGFCKGMEIQIISNENGPLIIGLDGTRIALGRGMAQKIMVQMS